MGDPPEEQADDSGAGGVCRAPSEGEGHGEMELAGGCGVSRCASAGAGVVAVRHGCMESRMA